MLLAKYFVVIVTLHQYFSYTDGNRGGGNALQWLDQPPSKLWFMVDQGGTLPCRARGSPPPAISWFTDDGIPVIGHPGVREILPNGSLYFPPNHRNAMSPQSDHPTIYYCHASNILGTLVSKNVQVRAVTNHQWQVRVYDQYVLDGNSAVISCEVPAFVKDFVSVTSWAQGTKNIYPGQNDGNRVQMVSTGQLVVHNVSTKDNQMAVKCRAVHTLTGETREAINAAHIYVTDSRNNVAPTISELKPQMIVRKGFPADLLCPAYGYPPPIITWLRRSTSMDYVGYSSGINERNLHQTSSGDVIVGQGPVLSFKTVEESHATSYTCSANNSLGVAFHQIRLEVTSALSSQIIPPEIKVPAGGVANMECSVSGSPVKSIHWLKDGIALPRSGRTIAEDSGRLLKVIGVRATDEGIYQCKVEGENDSAVGATHLTLGDTPPVLTYRFIEQTMQPGRSASLKCIASGRPTPSIKWSLDGFSISNMDRLVRGQFVRIGGDVVSHVNISGVSPLDGGLYACTATNAVGTLTHSARLNVYGLPVVRSMGKIDAVAGEPLALHCPVGGFPIHTISWKIGGKSLPLNRRQQVFENGSLIISNVQSMTDGGSYECTAATRAGEKSTQSVLVNVVVPPRILPFKSNHELREGSRLTLTCALTEGDLPLSFEWSWNRQPLSPEHRDSVHKIGEFSSYLIILNIQRHHAGNYTCKVSNAAGSVSKTATLYVQVPPRISPFAFKTNATSGIRLQVSCTLERGDPPIRFKWLKDGDPLQSREGGIASFVSRTLNLKIFQLDEFSNVLVIPKVTAQHSGNYTCYAANDIQEVEFTAPLTVSVPPRWEVEPMDIAVVVGEAVILPCKADGFPLPTTSWRRASIYGTGTFEDITGGVPGMQHLSNGSLLLNQVTKNLNGRYLCEATNGIGPGLSKVVKVSVQAPPSFDVKLTNVSYGIGAEAAIECKVRGDLPIDVSWRKNGMTLQTTNSYRFSMSTPPPATPSDNIDYQIYRLRIRNVNEEDGGKYSCLATNGYGTDARVVHLLILKPPNLPRSLHVLKKDSRSVMLAWQPPRNGNTPITKYTLQYSRQSNSPMPNGLKVEAKQLNIDGEHSSANVSNLVPAETYDFSLMAHNAMGSSPSSEPLQVTLDGEAPSGAPKGVSARGISSSALQISWFPPERFLTHGKIISYKIVIVEERFIDTKERIETVPDNKLSVEIGNLRAYSKYLVRVQAVNIHGNGPLSEQVSAFTMEDVPSAFPEELTCSSMTSRSLLVNWNELKEDDTRGRLLGYKVSYYSQEEVGEVNVKTKTTPSASVALRELTSFSNYSVRVAAFTSVGEGPYSKYIQCVTEEDVPNIISGLKGATSSANSIIVSWKPPTEPNGKLLTYTLTIKSPNGSLKKHTIHFPIRHFKVHLERNQKYVDASVAASTRIGEGPSTQPIRIQVSSTVPARIISWGSSQAIHLLNDATLPCHTVGEPRPTIQWLKGGQDVSTFEGRSMNTYPDGSLVIRNAKKEDSGNYTCGVQNIHGKDAITYSLLIQMPPEPPKIRIERAEKNSLTISWKEESTGGAPLLGVLLSFKEHFGGWKEVKVPPTEKLYLIKNLACGRSYQVFGTAFNKVGEGRPSEYVDAKTSGTAPVIDLRTPSFQANSTEIEVKFHGWRDGGCPITHFGVAYRRKTDSNWIVVSEQIDSSRDVDIRGLRPDTLYVVRVTAHNSAGVTTKDFSAKTSTKNGEPPKSEQVLSGFPTFLSDLRVILPLIASLLALVSACVTVSLCVKKRPTTRSSTVSEGSFDCAESYDECDKQKEHFYSTLKKMSPTLKSEATIDSSDDLNSYATIQMRSQPPSYVYQIPKEKNLKENNLSNCHYHPDRYGQQRHPMPLPNQGYAGGFTKLIPTKHRRPQDTLDSSYLTIESEDSSRLHRLGPNAKTESDEYDTFGSDSDAPNITSTRRPYLYQNKNNR